MIGEDSAKAGTASPSSSSAHGVGPLSRRSRRCWSENGVKKKKETRSATESGPICTRTETVYLESLRKYKSNTHVALRSNTTRPCTLFTHWTIMHVREAHCFAKCWTLTFLLACTCRLQTSKRDGPIASSLLILPIFWRGHKTAHKQHSKSTNVVILKEQKINKPMLALWKARQPTPACYSRDRLFVVGAAYKPKGNEYESHRRCYPSYAPQ